MYDILIKKALLLRQRTFEAFIEHGEAHLGGSFSMIEMLLALYECLLEPQDKFILSKSHASFPLCLLLRDHGLKPKVGTHLEIDEENGIHCTTGSLGHGLPIAVGMAIARKRLNRQGRIYVMISDGECQEGTTWESLLIAAAHSLDNITIMVDYNKIQALSPLQEALPLDNLSQKFMAFNCDCQEVMNGHSFDQLIAALSTPPSPNRPQVIVAHTIKGKGIKPFENDPAWHARRIHGTDLEIGRRALGIF